ncbi:MAG TPA: CCA tRNA nucleotidyltransferase [Deltaproteobacteria bacterium]|nr:CCA tRNA nucleotidyltransferase [Deltaproteobacteria bacterium]
MKRAFALTDVLEGLPEALGSLLERVAQASVAQDVRIHLVGGPVRDLVLGREIVDVDLVVEGDARGLARAVLDQAGADAFEVTSHERFGTVRIDAGDARIDLARMRHETYAHPGALPEVFPGTLEQDMARRDFGINAMALLLDARDPDRANPIFDPEGGLDDLEQRRIRILHPMSFHDDPTRAWRAARFAARLGFRVDRRSRNVMRDALRDGAFGAVSGERFRRELQSTFEEARRGVHAGQVLRSLSDWHVLSALEPGLTLGPDRMLPLRRLSRAIERPEWPAPRYRPWIAGLSIWLAPLPAALRRRTLERFSIRGEQAARIVRFGRDADRMLRGLARARGRGAVDSALADLSEETVQALYALAGGAVRRRILRWGAEDRRRRAPVGGADLAELGLTGPDVGRALARIRAGFLDGEIANREEALALAEEIAKRASRRKPGASGRGRRGRRTRASEVAPKGVIADTPGDTG